MRPQRNLYWGSTMAIWRPTADGWPPITTGEGMAT